MQMVQLGDPSPALFNREVVAVHFHQFSQLKHRPPDGPVSPTFNFNGLKWKLWLGPRGEDRQVVDDERASVSIYLRADVDSWKLADACTVKFSFTNQHLGITKEALTHTFHRTRTQIAWGWHDFAPRKDVLRRGCVDDTLTFIVCLEVEDDVGAAGGILSPMRWKPSTPLDRRYLKHLEDQFRTNIAFVVGKDGEKETIKANTEIIFFAAPLMEGIIDGINPHQTERMQLEDAAAASDASREILLPNIRPVHFRAFLRFLYAQDTTYLDAAHSDLQALLVVANQFGCCKLKLVIETRLCDDHLSYDTCIAFLLLADGLNCALLKESATAAVVQLWPCLLQHPDFPDLVQCSGLMMEIHHYSIGKRNSDDSSNDQYSKMSIRELYQILDGQEDFNFDSDLSRAELLCKVRSGGGRRSASR